MNIAFSWWEENWDIDTSDDDPARRITLFQKNPVRFSYKCPNKSKKQEPSWEHEYGFYFWNIEIENPVQIIQTTACMTLIKILEQSANPNRIIEKIFQNQN